MIVPVMIRILVLASSILLVSNGADFWYMRGNEKVYVEDWAVIPVQEVIIVGVE